MTARRISADLASDSSSSSYSSMDRMSMGDRVSMERVSMDRVSLERVSPTPPSDDVRMCCSLTGTKGKMQCSILLMYMCEGNERVSKGK